MDKTRDCYIYKLFAFISISCIPSNLMAIFPRKSTSRLCLRDEIDYDIDQNEVESIRPTFNESELGGGSESIDYWSNFALQAIDVLQEAEIYCSVKAGDNSETKFTITSPVSFDKYPVIAIELNESIGLLIHHIILPQNAYAKHGFFFVRKIMEERPHIESPIIRIAVPYPKVWSLLSDELKRREDGGEREPKTFANIEWLRNAYANGDAEVEQGCKLIWQQIDGNIEFLQQCEISSN